MTCRRDCLPKSVPTKYVNFIKAAPVNYRSKVARFEQPIIATKNIKHPEKNSPNDNVNDPQTAKVSKENNNYVLSETMIMFFAMYHSIQQGERAFHH
jgi:hypothetical protein